jgi:hypothetical protein
MIIPTVVAKTFLGWHGSGRTRPGRIECEVGVDTLEFVTKLKFTHETTKLSLICELLAVQLANDLGLRTADPAMVLIDRDFCESILESSDRERLERNMGLNFGSRYLHPGFGVPPVRDSLAGAELWRASEIFAFDALVQNVDRRRDNPNLLMKGNDLFLIDHDLALVSSILGIPHIDPWLPTAITFLKDHVFYKPLQGKNLELDGFRAKLDRLFVDGKLYEALANLPDEWTDGEESNLDKISKHFEGLAQHQDDFFESVTKILQ